MVTALTVARALMELELSLIELGGEPLSAWVLGPRNRECLRTAAHIHPNPIKFRYPDVEADKSPPPRLFLWGREIT